MTALFLPPPYSDSLLHSSCVRDMADRRESADPAPEGGDSGDPVPRSELVAVVEDTVSRALSAQGRPADGSGE